MFMANSEQSSTYPSSRNVAALAFELCFSSPDNCESHIQSSFNPVSFFSGLSTRYFSQNLVKVPLLSTASFEFVWYQNKELKKAKKLNRAAEFLVCGSAQPLPHCKLNIWFNVKIQQEQNELEPLNLSECSFNFFPCFISPLVVWLSTMLFSSTFIFFV